MDLFSLEILKRIQVKFTKLAVLLKSFSYKDFVFNIELLGVRLYSNNKIGIK